MVKPLGLSESVISNHVERSEATSLYLTDVDLPTENPAVIDRVRGSSKVSTLCHRGNSLGGDWDTDGSADQ